MHLEGKDWGKINNKTLWTQVILSCRRLAAYLAASRFRKPTLLLLLLVTSLFSSYYYYYNTKEGQLFIANVSMTGGRLASVYRWVKEDADGDDAGPWSHTRSQQQQQLIARWWAAMWDITEFTYHWSPSPRSAPNENKLLPCKLTKLRRLSGHRSSDVFVLNTISDFNFYSILHKVIFVRILSSFCK